MSEPIAVPLPVAPPKAPRPESPKKLKGYKRTAYAVWEITLKCNLACQHCGSRAGEERKHELSTQEAFDLIHQMADVGITEVSLIGGEAYLRPDYLELVKEIDRSGMIATMVTGGYGISRTTAQKMKDAGLAQISVSIDGLEEVHDRLRGKVGSWRQCMQSVQHFAAVGLPFGFNTQVNRLSAPDVPGLYEIMRGYGARAWQFSLTVPMGNAADRPEILIQPCELLELYPVLARVVYRAVTEGMTVLPGNDIGFFGPYEHIFRYDEHRMGMFWQGCQAGLGGLGIEADGAIKGCPSLPTDSYVGGNIKNVKLREILKTKELTFNTHGGTPKGVEHLWGFCGTCEHKALCRGGCTWTAHVFFDKPGNNPHCHHRALSMAKKGLRERVVQVEKAPGLPFDNGRFELVVEKLDAPWPEGDLLRFTRDRVKWSESWSSWPVL